MNYFFKYKNELYYNSKIILIIVKLTKKIINL